MIHPDSSPPRGGPIPGETSFGAVPLVESLISLGFVLLFCVIGWAAGAGAEAMIWGGIGLSAIGFGFGIPSAIVYHWMLHRSLARAERLPSRWWLSPTSHHDLIPRDDRGSVIIWAAIGGSGFLVIVLGIIITSIGLWRTLVSPS